MKTTSQTQGSPPLADASGSVRFRDGRPGEVEQVSQHGLLWIRDDKGNLSSADPKTGWSGDGNWRNDITPNTEPTRPHE